MKIFLDTNIISTATDEKVGQHPEVSRGQHVSKGKPDRDITVVMQSMVRRPSKEPNSDELRLLRDVANTAEASSAKFCWSHEVRLELLFQERVSSFIYGAAVDLVLVPSAAEYRDPRWQRFDEEPPGTYMLPGPVLKGFSITLQRHPERAAALVEEFLLRLPENSPVLNEEFRMFHSAARRCGTVPKNAATVLYPYLQRLQEARYLELLGILKVSQLAAKRKPNSYVDAFLLWTAELAGCTRFLTLDSGIVERHRHKSLVAVLPSQLLPEL